MADDDDDPSFIGEELFDAATLFGDELAETVDVAGATDVDMTHDHRHVHAVDLEEPIALEEAIDLGDAVDLGLSSVLRRLKLGAIAFFVLVAVLALVAEVAVSVQVSVAMATVLVGDVLLGRLRG